MDDYPPIEKLPDLIRGASTLISILDSRGCARQRFRETSQLDRLTVLFSSKRKLDVAAVVIVRCSKAVTATILASSEDTANNRYITTNSKTGAEQGSAPPIAKRASEVGEWKKDFIQNGPKDLAAHCAQLQSFAQLIHKSTKEEKFSHVAELKKYVQCQCSANIHARFTATIHRHTLNRFLDVLVYETDALRAFVQGDPGLGKVDKSATKLARNERSRVDHINQILSVSLVLDPEGAIALDGDNFFSYHTMVRRLFRGYEKALASTEEFRNRHTLNNRENSKLASDDILNFESALKTLQKSSDVMNDLAFRSPSFHRYVTSTAITNLLEFLNEDHSVDGELQEQEHFLEDEGLVQSRAETKKHPSKSLKTWLGLVVQWPEAIRVGFMITDIKAPMTISAVTVPPSGRRQAPLDEILESLLGASAVPRAKEILQERASDVEASGWESLRQENWDDWAHTFAGKHHCESSLMALQSCDEESPEVRSLVAKDKQFAYLLKNVKSTSPSVGVSKFCCFFCYYYAKIHGNTAQLTGTSGRVLPWDVPPWERNPEVLRKLWKKSKKTLLKNFTNLQIVPRTRRLSISDEGDSAPDDYAHYSSSTPLAHVED